MNEKCIINYDSSINIETINWVNDIKSSLQSIKNQKLAMNIE